MTLPKKQIIIAGLAFAVLAVMLAARRYLPAILPPFGRPPADITEFLPEDSVPPSSSASWLRADKDALNETAMPLTLPPGFRISVFAKDLPGARVMRFDRFGNLWVSRTSEGAVTLLEIDHESGTVRNQGDIFIGLRKPHGLAFNSSGFQLYIAEEHRVRRVTTYSDDPGEDVVPLPTEGGGHFTRTLGFGSDGALYVSIGSSCNVCRESDERRASILRVDLETKRSEVFARGLRNAVFFTWHPVAAQLWATEMGRDWLGDDLPPDEVNVVEAGGPSTGFRVNDYGWPICYGRNIHDSDFDTNVYIRDPCAEKKPSAIDIPAHSAPLGLAFIPPQSGWPEGYWYDLLVAYHGSWNRSRPTGYKVVRHKFDASGDYEGAEDFISGWLTPEGALGRPVDIVVEPGGVAYLSDDKAGVIYKIERRGSQ